MEQTIREIRAKVFNGMSKDIMDALEEALKVIRSKVNRTQTLVISILVSIMLGLIAFITIGRIEANTALTRDHEITTTLKLLTQRLEFDERLLGIGADPIPTTPMPTQKRP